MPELDLRLPRLLLKQKCVVRYNAGYNLDEVDPYLSVENVVVGHVMGLQDFPLPSSTVDTTKVNVPKLVTAATRMKKFLEGKSPSVSMQGKLFILSSPGEYLTFSLSPIIFRDQDWITDPYFLMNISRFSELKRLHVFYLDFDSVVTYDFSEEQLNSAGVLQTLLVGYLDSMERTEFNETEPTVNETCPSCILRTSCTAYKKALSGNDADISAWLDSAKVKGLDNADVRIGLVNARRVTTGRVAILESIKKAIDQMLMAYASTHEGSIQVQEVGLSFVITQQFRDSIVDMAQVTSWLKAQGVWKDEFQSIDLSAVKKALPKLKWEELVSMGFVKHSPTAPFLREGVTKK